jgi:N utilization substance protein B
MTASRRPICLGFDSLLQQALASLAQHVREALDNSELDLQQAQQQLLDSELVDGADHLPQVRDHLQRGLAHAEQALNRLSASLELPRLLMLADQREIREGALARTRAVLQDRRGPGCTARCRDGRAGVWAGCPASTATSCGWRPWI